MSDQRSAAHLIVECLENEGVTHVFGIPGEENIRLVEALSESSIEYVLTRHEQGASFMAETYGRLTGRAGVCSATLGPGRDQPAARHRRRHHQLDAAARAVGAGRHEPQLQGVAPGRRPGVDVRAGDQVVGAGGHPGRGAGDGPQGVQARADRASRRGVPRGARRTSRRPTVGPDLDAAARSTSRAPTTRRPRRSSGPPTSCAAPRNPVVLAGHGAARAEAARRAAPLRRDARTSRWPPRSTARACSPTTIRSRSARSASCATTTSTSASTGPT